ncbi:TPA: arylamine N-acetyltransferase [Bacillus thuringiensis]
MKKILLKKRGGLCYEINSLLYYFYLIVYLICIK